MLLRLQWTAYNDRNGTYVPSIGEVYHTIMKRGYEINSGSQQLLCCGFYCKLASI